MNHYAIVFPGQGSQSLNMLNAFSEQHPEIVQEYCRRASAALSYDIGALIASGPEDKLNQTEYTQPALLLAGVVAWKIWQSKMRIAPAYFSGHSLGEYTALTCSGALEFEDAITLVRLRGQYMQSAVPEGEGAMAAIVGLDNQKIQTICQAVGEESEVAPANFNSIGQVVIAGKRFAVEKAMVEAKLAGAKIATLLPMSVPSHCHLMLPAAERLKHYLENVVFHSPKIPVINNVDVSIEDQPEKIKEALVKQLYSPVRWVEVIQKMGEKGVKTIVECGPGKVLTSLTKRIDKEIKAFSVLQTEDLKEYLC